MARKTSDRRQLDKLASALARAEADLASAGQRVEKCQGERDRAFEDASASALIDGDSGTVKLNGKVERALAEALATHERASAAARGLRRQCEELGAEVTTAELQAASRAVRKAEAEYEEASRIAAEKMVAVERAKSQLAATSRLVQRSKLLWDPTTIREEEAARARRAEEVARDRLSYAPTGTVERHYLADGRLTEAEVAAAVERLKREATDAKRRVHETYGEPVEVRRQGERAFPRV